MNIVEMKGVKKDYPLGETTVHAVKGVDLHVEEGELVSIIGPSGSGKTTLLNIIGCIDDLTEGSLRIDDQDVFSVTSMTKDEFFDKYPKGVVTDVVPAGYRIKAVPVKENGDKDPSRYLIHKSMNDKIVTDLRLFKIGFIFQTFNLIPVLNIIENVEFPLLLMKKYSKDEVRERALQMIGAVGLKEYTDHKPAELSGGQRQRVAIARALVTKPDIILADEPTANLDSTTGKSILELMSELNRTEKTTFIFSTHDPEVLEYARRTVKIRDGIIAQA